MMVACGIGYCRAWRLETAATVGLHFIQLSRGAHARFTGGVFHPGMNATIPADAADDTVFLTTHGEKWYHHFKLNAAHPPRIDWTPGAALSPERHARLLRSIQSWQLGESSDGSHLMRATDDFLSRRPDDPWYREAMLLFIREEQKHGANLGRYLDLAGTPRLKFDLGDFLFRKVRYFIGSMEMWTSSVFMVESMAEIYYKALADSGLCPVLKEVCEDILRDEAWHIQFQLERLRIQDREMGALAHLCYRGFSRFLFLNIIGSIWLLHRAPLEAGGLTFSLFWAKAWRKFSRW